jgi:signal transduction histidine kinase
MLIVGLEPDGTVAMVNAAVEALAGEGRGDLIGRRFDELLAAPACFAADRSTVRALRTREGPPRRVEWRLVPGGALSWVFGVDLGSAGARRLRLVDPMPAEPEAPAPALVDLASPLDAALVELTVLARRLVRSRHAGDEASVALVRLELGRIERLITDFLWFARPLAAPTRSGLLAVPAGAALALVADEAGARRVVVTADFDRRARPVALDEESMRQGIAHLIRNGLEAAGEGGRVALRVRAASGATELDVEDDGPGIEGDPARVFETRADPRAGGPRLGLSIARRVAAAHGGGLRVESAPGRTVFTLSLPTLPGLATVGGRPPV